jgi:hypothetical protein
MDNYNLNGVFSKTTELDLKIYSLKFFKVKKTTITCDFKYSDFQNIISLSKIIDNSEYFKIDIINDDIISIKWKDILFNIIKSTDILFFIEIESYNDDFVDLPDQDEFMSYIRERLRNEKIDIIFEKN